MTGSRETGGERGQALVETVVFMPVLLLSLFAVLWAIQAGVQYERIELAVRYSGMMQQLISPYTDFSFAGMYGQLQPAAPPPVPCASPPSSLLSDGAPYLPMPPLRVPSPPLFTPATVASPLACRTAGTTYGLAGSATGTTTAYVQNGQPNVHVQIEDDIFSIQQPRILSQVIVPSYLTNALGTRTSLSSTAESFERGPTVAQILFCYQSGNLLRPSIDEQLTNTLRWSTDPNAVVVTAALPNTVPPAATTANYMCVSGGSAYQ